MRWRHTRRRKPLIVSLTFDDGTESQYAACGLLAARELHATFYVNSGFVGRPGFLSEAQLRALQDAGHEIGGHTVSHTDLSTAGPEEARREIADDRRSLLALGLEAASFAYPYGRRSSDAVRLVRDAGYAGARRAWGLRNDGFCANCPVTESIPAEDRYQVRTADGLRWDTSLDELEAMVARAVDHGGWLPLVFHDVGVESEWGVREAVFVDLLDGLAERRGAGQLEVATVSRVLAAGRYR